MLRLGLRTKFFLYSNTLIIVTMTIVTVLAVVHGRRSRYEAVRLRGRSITDSLSIPITDALMYEDLGLVTEEGLIDNYTGEILRRNQDLVLYVIVADPTGKVTHSNRWELLGARFDRALGPEQIGDESLAQIIEIPGDGRVLEVRSPLNISTHFWGSVIVAFSLEQIDEEVRAIRRNAMLVALILMIGNSLMTAIYVETLIRPLLKLHRTMKRAGRGDLAVRADCRRGDEVGELAEAFNRMMDELEDSRRREKIAQTQLGHTEKMAAVGTLAAGVAHEVNNPLGGILTCIENLRADPDDVDMRERYLGMITDGLKRIGRTVANLLDFSRPRELQAEPTSINHNLRHVSELVEYQALKVGVEVVMDLDPHEPTVLADHYQMEQLFLNLILNALQAMPEGGTLTLGTHCRGDSVIAEIRDTGEGIPEEIRDRIFDPFFTTREVGKGTGLGLAVSHSIVAAHGGIMGVESAVGKGTVFRISLASMDSAAEERAG